MQTNPPSFTLPNLLSGDHNDLLRKLAAMSVGWEILEPEVWPAITYNWGKSPTDAGNYKTILPDYFDSLDACRELLSALTDEEWETFEGWLSGLLIHTNAKRYLQASPLQILIAFCLTRNLIRLVEQ